MFFSCGCCCLEITCKLKNFFPCIFLPTLFFFLPLKPESEQGRRTSLEKFTRSVVSSAGFLSSTFLLLLVLQTFFFPSLFGCRLLWGGRGVQCFPSSHSPLFFCKCLQLLFQGWNYRNEQATPLCRRFTAQGPAMSPVAGGTLWPLFKALRRKGPYCSGDWVICASSTADWGEGHEANHEPNWLRIIIHFLKKERKGKRKKKERKSRFPL